MADAKVNFYTEDVLLQVRAAEAETLEAIAFRVQERAQANVVQNDQVDTGAMLNGIYVVLQGGGDYGSARLAAEARNPNGQMAPQVAVRSQNEAAVVAGMEYSIYQEMQRSFLYTAAEETSAEVGGLIKVL